MKRTPEQAKELPSNFCHRCRRWVVSQEAVNMLEHVDGARKPVTVWTCPGCRGEEPAVQGGQSPTSATQADVAKDERLGPYRAVKAETVAVNPSGVTARAKLECGHEACVSVKPDGRPAARARCRKCRSRGLA